MKDPVETCFACGEVSNEPVTENYRLELPNDKYVVVSDLRFLRCQNCGEETIPADAGRRIDSAIEKG